MKKGAGENPFADDTGVETNDTESSARTDDSSGETEQTPQTEQTTETETQTETAADASPSRSMQIPYKFRRDGVQDGRSRVPLFLQSENKAAERDALRELEDRFDGDVSLTDLREALVIVGLDHLDEVETQLEAWGYGMTFD